MTIIYSEFSIENGGSFHSFLYVYQALTWIILGIKKPLTHGIHRPTQPSRDFPTAVESATAHSPALEA